MLPIDWTLKSFAEVADYSAGRTPARANPAFWEGDGNVMPWVAISDMEQHGLVTETKEAITSAAFEQVFRGRCVRAGTLLMSFKLTIGRVATVGVDACHNEAIISIFPKAGIDQRYLGYWLSQVDYADLQDRQIKGNTLNQDKIDRIPVAVPDFREQVSIADVLDVIRQAVRAEADVLAYSNELKRATMRELFSRGLRGEALKETEIGPIPERWEVLPLGEIASLERGRFLHRPRNEPRFYGGNTPFVQTGDVVRSGGRIANYSQTLNEDGVVISRVFSRGTILITIAANIGYTGILQMDCACPDSLVGISPTKINTEYLEHFLRSQQPEMDRKAPIGTQKNINIEFLKPWPIAVPSDGEQTEIVAILNAIDAKIELHQRKQVLLEELFRTLLHKLMAGEIRVSDLDLSALEPEGTT